MVIVVTLLTQKFLKKGNEFVAAGFGVFAIGESAMLYGTAVVLVVSITSLAVCIVLWVPAMAAQREYQISISQKTGSNSEESTNNMLLLYKTDYMEASNNLLKFIVDCQYSSISNPRGVSL